MMTQQAINRKREIVETLIGFGYRVAWVNPDGTIAHGFKDGQTYPYEAYTEEYERAEALALILDRHILLDCDFYKWDASTGEPQPTREAVAAKLGLDELPYPVQQRADGLSSHHLFAYPSNFTGSLRCSDTGKWMTHVDLKTGNQVMHIKLTKEMDLNDLDPKTLPVANEKMLDILRAQDHGSNPTQQAWTGASWEVDDAIGILASIPVPDDYDDWLQVGMALHHKFGDTDIALDLWDDWSYQDKEGYAGRNHMAYKLSTFGNNRGSSVTMATLADQAKANGCDLSELGRKKKQAQEASNVVQHPSAKIASTVDLAERAIANRATAVDEWGEPEDWFKPVSTPRFHLSNLPKVIRERSEILAGDAGHDPVAYGVAGLIAMSGAIDARVRLCLNDITDWYISPTLWMLLYGDSAAAKTPAAKAATKHAKKLDAEANKLWINEMAEWKVRAEKAEKDGDPPPDRPESGRCIIQNTTIEKMRDILADTPRGLLSVRDEFEELIGSFDAYRGGGKGASQDRALYLQLFDGGPLVVDRISSGSVYVPNWSVGMLVNGTPSGMRKLARHLNPDGLLQRFLVVAVKPAGAWPEEQISTPEEAKKATQRYEDLMDDLYKINPCTIRMTDEAAKLVRDYDRRVKRESEALAQIDTEDIVNLHRKAVDKMGRIALVLHCIQYRHQAADHRLGTDTAEQAIRIMDDLFHHAMTMFSDLGRSSWLDLTISMAKSIVADEGKWRESMVVSWTDIRQMSSDFKRCDSDELRAAAIGNLVDSNWLKPTGKVYGRRECEWHINPALIGRFDEIAELQREARRLVVQKFFPDEPEQDEPDLPIDDCPF